MDFTFLHAADLHLDSPLLGLEADAPASMIRGASRRALANLVSLALEQRAAFVLLSGDLYDVGWRAWQTGHFLVQQLAQLEREGIRVFSISGNHDAERVLKNQLRLPGRMFGAAEAGREVLAGLNVAITGQSYAERQVTHDMAALYPPPEHGMLNIAMLHTSCGVGGHENYAPCTPAQLAAAGYDYWALGHVHARRVLGEAPWIVFPGVLQGRHINEPGANGATLVQVSGGRIAAVQHRPLDVLRWARVSVDVAAAGDAEAVLDLVRDALGQALAAAEGCCLAVRVRLHGATPAHAALASSGIDLRARITGVANELAAPDELWVETVELATGPAFDLAALRAEPGAAGLLIRALDDETGLADRAAEHARALLAKPGLAAALPPGSAVARVLAGELPPELVRQARDLLLGLLRAG